MWLLLTIEWFIYWQLLNALINPSCNQEAIEGGTFCGKEPHPQRPIPPARSSPTNPSSIPLFDPLTSPTCHSWQARKAGHKKKQNVAMGTKCGVLGMHRHPPLARPTVLKAGTREQKPKQVANRRLPSGSSSLGLPELKKSIYTPNLLHPTLGLTEVRVWFERRRPILSPSMACWIKSGLIS